MQKKIAIIGAGPGGLVAAKECLEAGMEPTVFEKSNGLGGLWNPDHGNMWDGMYTNLSKYHMAFSDFPFPDTMPDFPHNKDVFAYLENYAEAFGVDKVIRYQQNVSSVSYRGSEDQWDIIANGTQHTFDATIIASGVFGKGRIPDINGIADFKGRILHSGDYKSPDPFRGKRNLVIGSSFSAYEIAANLAENGVETVHAFRRPSWILGRYVNDVPLDLVSSNYPKKVTDGFLGRVTNRERNQRLEKNFGNPGTLHPQLAITQNYDMPIPVVISDHYAEGVRSGFITPLRTEIDRLTYNACCMKSGRTSSFDNVIFGTGYDVNLNFMDPKILSTCEYDPQDNFQPLILNKSTLRPEYKSLAFVGVYRGPYFPVMEMEARWIAAILSGQIKLPGNQSYNVQLQIERDIRNQDPRPDFPRRDYPGFMMKLANEIGVLPTDLWAPGSTDTPMLPADFRRFGIGKKPELAEETRKKTLIRMGLHV